MTEDITVEREYGMVLVRDTSLDDFQRRWWFQETSASRLVLREEVAHNTSTDGRVAVDKADSDVPERVVTALGDEGYTDVYGPDLEELA